MAEIIWTEPAIQSLDEIADYIALDNLKAAQDLVLEVFDQLERLKEHPLSGRTIPELDVSIYREIIVSPCRVFYRVDGDKLYVVAIIREEQQFRNPFY